MKINQILMFISTAVVLYSMLSSGTVDAWVTGKSCWTNGNCHSSEFCNNFICNNACAEKNCPETHVCQVSNHRATCLCPSGYVTNQTSRECTEEIITSKPCSDDSVCQPWEICANKGCIDACGIKKCRDHQGCVSKNHKSSCHCLSGFELDTTLNKCVEHVTVAGKTCSINGDCDHSEICKHKLCINSCTELGECPENEGCQVKNHEATCECLHSYARNMNSHKCEKEDCVYHQDCLGREYCKIIDDGIRKCECLTNHTRNADGVCEQKCDNLLILCGNYERCNFSLCTCYTGYEWNNEIKECKVKYSN